MRYLLMMMLLLCSCTSSDYDNRVKALNVVLKEKIGNSPDYFVMKKTFGNGEAHPVMLVFGYVDDLEVCKGLVKAMKHNEDTFGSRGMQEGMYFCQAANR